MIEGSYAQTKKSLSNFFLSEDTIGGWLEICASLMLLLNSYMYVSVSCETFFINCAIAEF